MSALEIDAFASRIRCKQNQSIRIVQKSLLCCAAFFTAHASMHHDDGFWSAYQSCDLSLEVAKCVAVFGKDDEFLVWRCFRTGNVSRAIRARRFSYTICEPSRRENS